MATRRFLTSLAAKRGKLQATILLPLETRKVARGNCPQVRHQNSCAPYSTDNRVIYTILQWIHLLHMYDQTANDEFLIQISRRQIFSLLLQTSSNKEQEQRTQTAETFYMLHTTTWGRIHSKRTGDTADQTPTYSKRRGPEPGKG